MVKSCILLVMANTAAWGTSCEWPPPPEWIQPNMAVFLGVPDASARESQAIRVQVTDVLWGLDARTKTVEIRTYEHERPGPEGLFFALLRNQQGELYHRYCETLVANAADPLVRALLQRMKANAPATLPIRVACDPSWANIVRAGVIVEGNGKRYAGSTNGEGIFTVRQLPAGTYRVRVSKAGFAGKIETMSVAPGAAGKGTVRLQANSRITGRIVYANGQPASNLRQLHLIGWEGGKQDYGKSLLFDTRLDGSFEIKSVAPGLYYLGANIWGSHDPKATPLPRVFFPGVLHFDTARPLTVRTDESITGLTFRLPDFGPKRRVTITTVDASGKPLADVLVENGPSEFDVLMAGVPETKTDASGRAVVEVWSMAAYNIGLRWIGKGGFDQRTFPVRPGRDDVAVTITMRNK